MTNKGDYIGPTNILKLCNRIEHYVTHTHTHTHTHTIAAFNKLNLIKKRGKIMIFVGLVKYTHIGCHVAVNA